MTQPQPTHGSPNPARLVAAHHAARDLYRRHLLAATGPRRYLHDRGLGPFTRNPDRGGIAAPWHVGYAPPGWTTLVNHLTAQGFTPAELLAAGLATPTRHGLVDVFRDRIVFPIHNHDGQPVAFLGRAAPGADPDVPKYINSTDTPIYHKRQMLYGLGEQNAPQNAGLTVLLVEGPTDVLATWLHQPQPGYLALATCGTSLTEQHAITLAALPAARHHGVLTAFDADPAGQHATLHAFRILSGRTRLTLSAAVLPAGSDPADLAHRYGTHALRTALANRRPLAQAAVDITLDQYLAQRRDALTFIEGRHNAIHTVAGLLVDLPAEQIIALAQHIAQRTGSRLDAVADIIVDRMEHDPPTRPPRAAHIPRDPPPRDGPTKHTSFAANHPTAAQPPMVFPPLHQTSATPAAPLAPPAAARPGRQR